MVLAAAHFIHQARQKLIPNLQALAQSARAAHSREGPSDPDMILLGMAVHNFPANLEILADLIVELYMRTASQDRQAHGKKPPNL